MLGLYADHLITTAQYAPADITVEIRAAQGRKLLQGKGNCQEQHKSMDDGVGIDDQQSHGGLIGRWARKDGHAQSMR